MELMEVSCPLFCFDYAAVGGWWRLERSGE